MDRRLPDAWHHDHRTKPVGQRLVRYCARNPMAPDGPMAGTAALDPLEFLIPVR
jgi:hypothetical protein